MVVKNMLPFSIPIIIRHPIFRVPKRDHHFDNHPHGSEVKDLKAKRSMGMVSDGLGGTSLSLRL